MTLMPEAAISLIICEISVMPCQSALSVVQKEKEENAAPSPNAPREIKHLIRILNEHRPPSVSVCVTPSAHVNTAPFACLIVPVCGVFDQS